MLGTRAQNPNRAGTLANPGTERRVTSAIDLSLDTPSAFLFTGEICSKAYRLNKFAFDFKQPAVRARFANDPETLMTDYGLSDREKTLVRARDWTGLVASGGHHFNVIKVAAAVGESHLHVGAHMSGVNWDEFKQTLPHRMELMPQEIGATPSSGAGKGAARSSEATSHSSQTRRRAGAKPLAAATRARRTRGKKSRDEK
jgi:protocatechuate 4,5-dioxygenase, alpha chain